MQEESWSDRLVIFKDVSTDVNSVRRVQNDYFRLIIMENWSLCVYFLEAFTSSEFQIIV